MLQWQNGNIVNKENFLRKLNNPALIEKDQTTELKGIVYKYPFFQAARVLYLKSLKEQESFLYNSELKKTSVFITDRNVLFNFISSELFLKKEKLQQDSEVKTILKTNTTKKIEKTETLEIGKPLSFEKNEKHSFTQWIQLSTSMPVERNETKTAQESIIDNFISLNPRISRTKKTEPSEIKPIEQHNEKPKLMTETLAKVYLEQKKFDNAIKAYQILSLKYPEKSSFFADQINQIRILQKNK